MSNSLAVLFVCMCVELFACDICNMDINLIPESNKNTISLNYRSRFTSGKYNAMGILESNPYRLFMHTGPRSSDHYNKKVNEIFEVYTLSSNYFISERLNISMILPFSHNIQLMDGEKTVETRGVSDPIVLGNYEIINTKRVENASASFRWTIGGGVKLPLGKWTHKKGGTYVDIDLQNGTGSTDMMLTSEYTMRYKNAGLLMSANFKYNTTNTRGYRYGNSYNQQLTLFYLQKLGKMNVMPHLALYHEVAGQDVENKQLLVQSGGEVVLASTGLNVYFNKIRIDCTYQHGAINNLNGKTQLNTKSRWLAGIVYYLN